jgi:hypothetical protein
MFGTRINVAGVAQSEKILSYGMDDQGSVPGMGNGGTFSSPPPRLDWLWDPLNLLSNGYKGSFPGAKRQKRESDNLPLYSADVKNAWSYTSTPIRLHYMVLS